MRMRRHGVCSPIRRAAAVVASGSTASIVLVASPGVIPYRSLSEREQRPLECGFVEVGHRLDRDPVRLHRDRLAVSEAETGEPVDGFVVVDAEADRHVGPSSLNGELQQPVRRLPAPPAHVLGERREPERLGIRRFDDEGSGAGATLELAGHDQDLDRVAHGHAGDAPLTRQVPFARDSCTHAGRRHELTEEPHDHRGLALDGSVGTGRRRRPVALVRSGRGKPRRLPAGDGHAGRPYQSGLVLHTSQRTSSEIFSSSGLGGQTVAPRRPEMLPPGEC